MVQAYHLPRLPISLLDVPSQRHPSAYTAAYAKGRTQAGSASAMRWGAVGALLILAAAAAFLLHAHGRTAAEATAQRYVLVMDAGSSGTRIYAYTWAVAKEPNSLPVLTAIPPSQAAHKIPKKEGKGLYNRVETQPGLDRFLGDAHGLRTKALGPLLEWAQAVLPKEQWAQVPLFLFGTGGLRRLHDREQQELMGDIRKVLAASGFRFQEQWARVISGMQEGVYGWVALNYEEGTLQPTPAAPASIRAPPHTLAALDLGGSSLEITFEMQGATMPREQVLSGVSSPAAVQRHLHHPLVNATVAGSNHVLYTHTFHHYGLNDAYDRAVTLLLEQQQLLQQQQQQQQQQADQTLSSAAPVEQRSTQPSAPSGQAGIPQQSSGSSAAAQAAQPPAQAHHALSPAAQQPGHKLQSSSREMDASSSMVESSNSIIGSSGSSGSSSSSSSSGTSSGNSGRSASKISGNGGGIHADSPPSANTVATVSHHRSLRQDFRPKHATVMHQRLLRSLITVELLQPDPHLTAANQANSDSSPGQLPSRHLHQHSSGSRRDASRMLARGMPHTGSPSWDATAPAPAPSSTQLQGAASLPVLHHPCLHKGYSAPYTRLSYSGIAPRPAAVLLQGGADWGRCLALVRQVVNASAPCARPVQEPHGGAGCRLGSMQPPLTGKFVALTGFYVVWTFFGLPPEAPLQQLSRAARALCERPWQELARSPLGGSINLERYCAWGPYVETLLTEGLGLSSRDVRIGSGSVAWTLGAALAEASRLPDMMAQRWRGRKQRAAGRVLGRPVLRRKGRVLLRAWQVLVLLCGAGALALLLMVFGLPFNGAGLQSKGSGVYGGGLSPAVSGGSVLSQAVLPIVQFKQSQSRMRPSNSRVALY